MNITKVSYSHKFNLGNYETCDLGVEAQLNEKDNLQEVWNILADNVEMWFINKMRSASKQDAKLPTVPQPPTVTPLPTPSPTPIKWEQMPPTEKGPWEKTVDTTNPKIQQIITKLDQENRPIFCEDGVYWLMKTDGKIEGVGRRLKT